MTDQSTRTIGRSIPRTDAYEKVTGQAVYPGDLSRPGMLHMKILFAGRPHARIVALDSRRARAVPGVVAVLTAEDVPVNSYGLAQADQPVLCGDVVRFEGDQVAAVIAETEDAAARARDLIEVVYEDLPVITDPREAMQPGSYPIHADHPDNVLQYFPVRKGDVAQEFARADAVVSGTYYLPMQEHAYLQPEAGLAYTDGDQVVIETAGQWAHHDQRQIARALGMDPDRIRVIYRAIGGAFGGREDLSVQIVLALAALKTGRPVKIVWSREESIRGHCKRHQMYIRARWGATREGKLTAAEVELIGDAGAYNYTSTMVLGQAVLTCTGVYEIPNVHVDAYMIYTNNVPGGAFRGFGSPQGLFAAEQQIEKLAERLGIDPITMRERNLLTPDSLLAVGTRLPADLHLGRLLEVCAEAAGWTRTETGWARPERADGSNPARRRGTGLAIGLKNVGFSYGYQDDSSAVVELHGAADIEEAVVYYAGAECGQGTHTAVAQMAAEALSLPLDRVRLVTTDTARTPEAGSASASRLTLMAGNAVIGAAEVALERWRDEDRPAVGAYTYHAPATRDYDPVTGNSVPNFAYGTVAQAVEVEVDTESGEVTVPRVISVVDVGRAINPRAIEGQVEGAVAQGLGYALLENYITQGGASLTPWLSTYLLPTTVDMPPAVETHILELDEPLGPWGASGVGEHSLIGVPAALAAAVKDAAGRWINRLPLTPSTVLDALEGGDLDHSVES
jgi:CO/xanthine dehydrogenase Mo-binding subunit